MLRFIFITLGGNKELWKNKKFNFIRLLDTPTEERNKKEVDEILNKHQAFLCQVTYLEDNNRR